MSECQRRVEGVGSVSRQSWAQPWLGPVLLVALAGVLLFLAFVVVPSVGASGGCGGG